MAKMLIEKAAEFKIDLNAKNETYQTPFHLACANGNLEIAEIFVQKSVELKIDLNVKDQYGRSLPPWIFSNRNYGRSPFYIACENGHTKTAEMLVQKSVEFKIRLNDMDINGSTAFHLACEYGLLKLLRCSLKIMLNMILIQMQEINKA